MDKQTYRIPAESSYGDNVDTAMPAISGRSPNPYYWLRGGGPWGSFSGAGYFYLSGCDYGLAGLRHWHPTV